MATTEKTKNQSSMMLVAYIIISILAGLSSFKYLAPKFVNPSVVVGIYALISIAFVIYLYTKTNRQIANAGKKNTPYDLITEQDRKAQELQEQEKLDKELKRRKKEEDKRKIADTVAEIEGETEGETDIEKYFDQILINISKAIKMVQGVAYTADKSLENFAITSTYAYYTTETDRTFALGEGIPGQVAKDQKLLFLDNVPEGYIQIVSGLGTSSPKYLIVAPIIHDGKTLAVLEMAMFEKPDFDLQEFHKQFTAKVSNKVESLVKK